MTATAPDTRGASNRRPFRDRIFHPIDPASLVVIRVVFGLIMVIKALRYFDPGHLSEVYVDPPFHFLYYGFEWIPALSLSGLKLLLIVQAVTALGIAIGLFYRACALLFFVSFSFRFLMEQSQYLNHDYLISLVAFLLIFIPAHRRFSLDALRRPEHRSRPVRAWHVWLLRFQMGVVYFYGGIAKINQDWLRGYPLRDWLARRADTPVIGSLLDEAWAPLFFSYSGLVIDLFAVPLLLWRRTRMFAFVILVAFHLTNRLIFDIGVFPWISIAFTTTFLAPSWPRRLLRIRPWQGAEATVPPPRRARPATALLAAWVAIQLLMPLRHWAYPGDVVWTEEGHRFAWRMKLRGKSGYATFALRDTDTGQFHRIDPMADLTPRQYRKMCGRPDMVLQFARFIARREQKRTGHRFEVRAVVKCSVNGRPLRQLVDSSVDLAALERGLGHKEWVLDFDPVRAGER